MALPEWQPQPERLAPIEVRRDKEIYSATGSWFSARWHFSFDRYFDPRNMGVGALRVFNHDTLIPGAAWPMHPHRDVEGITYVVAGEFEHADSLGNDGVLTAGGVQRMTLGSGASHSEGNHLSNEPMQFIQLWILPSRPGIEPSVEQRQFFREDRQNRLLQIVRPEGTSGSGVTVHQDASVYVARLDPAMGFAHVIEPGRLGYAYVIECSLTLNGETLQRGDAAKVLGGGVLQGLAIQTAELILVDVPQLQQ